MATSQTSTTEPTDDVSDIKRKLAWRMGFAGLMIVALLGALALFDHFSVQHEPDTVAPQFNEPVPVAKKVVTQPLAPAELPPDSVKNENKSAVPESTAAPADKLARALEPPPRPEVAAQPVLPRSSPPPVGRAVPASGASLPVMAAKPAETRAVVPSPATTRTDPPPVTVQPLPVPSPPRLFSGYALQAGVFSDPRRAEELHAKLTLEGIPSTIEARVQVGPFKSKEEAEAARLKMKALGIDAVMLLPKGARR